MTLAQVTSETMMGNSFIEILEGMGADKTYSKPTFCNARHEFHTTVEASGSAIRVAVSKEVWSNGVVKNVQTIWYFYKLKDEQFARIHDNTLVFVSGSITYICNTHNVECANCTTCLILSQEPRAQ